MNEASQEASRWMEWKRTHMEEVNFIENLLQHKPQLFNSSFCRACSNKARNNKFHKQFSNFSSFFSSLSHEQQFEFNGSTFQVQQSDQTSDFIGELMWERRRESFQLNETLGNQQSLLGSASSRLNFAFNVNWRIFRKRVFYFVNWRRGGEVKEKNPRQ